MEEETKGKDLSEYIRLAYSSALEDIRFFKRQQFTVTNYTILIYIAIVTIFKDFKIICREWWIFFTLAIMIISFLVITHLQCSLGNVRSRKDKVKFKLPPELRKLFFKDTQCEYFDKYSIFALLLFIILTGGIFSIWILWTMPFQIFWHCPF